MILFATCIFAIFGFIMIFDICKKNISNYRKFRKFLWKKPVFATIFLSGIITVILSFVQMIWGIYLGNDTLIEILYYFGGSLFFIFIFIVYPFLLNILNIAGLFMKKFWARNFKIEMILLVYGAFCTLVWGSSVTEIQDSNWSEPIYSFQKHLPVWTECEPTFIFMCIAALTGYLILRLKKSTNTPPLLFVLSISGMYIGIFICIMWCIQVHEDIMLCVYPINCIIVAVKVIDDKIYEWKKYRKRQGEIIYKDGFFGVCEKILDKSELWGILGFVFAIPLLGIIMCILLLFGQQPDYIIKMWTETADWTLSRQTPPPYLEYDGHYLCTVAAGGHRKVVKPLRYGYRHDHYIIVNRQLCIANAFEQIIEEKTPKFHRMVRYIYDKYGFPIAKLIKSKFAADVVYIIMKPLEWLFLAVIYLCDVKPENRIAVQYMPER